MKPKRAFFGTFWRGGLGAVGRCLAIAQSLKAVRLSCYFFAEDVAENFVRQAGFIPVRPPEVAPPKEGFSMVEELMMGDVTLISGVESTDRLPVDEKTRHCGPLLWFPGCGKDQLQSIPKDQKVAWVYGTDSDSWVGGRFLIREIVPLLAEMGFFVLVSSGGHPVPSVHHPQVLCVKNIPGDLAARRAELVVGRGGHDLFWTAIMAGKPFFGVPPNSEWLNYCQSARALGVGDYAEIDNMNRDEIADKINRLVTSPQVAIKIEELRLEAEKCMAQTSLLNVIQEFWPDLLSEGGFTYAQCDA